MTDPDTAPNFYLVREGVAQVDPGASTALSDRPAPPVGQPGQDGSLLINGYLELEGAIDQQFKVIVSETETSALALIKHVRALSDSASALLKYLETSDASAQHIESNLQQSLEAITQITKFIEELPDIIRADARGEVRLLAEDSSKAVSMIENGLSKAKSTLLTGLKSSEMDQQKAAAIVGSFTKMQHNYEDMRQYYRTLFAVVTRHNAGLIELSHKLDDDGTDLAALSAQMFAVLEDYQADEQRHEAAGDPGDDDAALPKFELF